MTGRVEFMNYKLVTGDALIDVDDAVILDGTDNSGDVTKAAWEGYDGVPAGDKEHFEECVLTAGLVTISLRDALCCV